MQFDNFVNEILFESFEEDLAFLSTNGCSVLDVYEVGNIKMALVNTGPYKQITMSDGGPFFLPDDQTRTNKTFQKGKKDLTKKVLQWFRKYGEIYVGSFDERKTNFYFKVLNRDFVLSDIELFDQPMIGKTYVFSIKDEKRVD